MWGWELFLRIENVEGIRSARYSHDLYSALVIFQYCLLIGILYIQTNYLQIRNLIKSIANTKCTTSSLGTYLPFYFFAWISFIFIILLLRLESGNYEHKQLLQDQLAHLGQTCWQKHMIHQKRQRANLLSQSDTYIWFLFPYTRNYFQFSLGAKYWIDNIGH